MQPRTSCPSNRDVEGYVSLMMTNQRREQMTYAVNYLTEDHVTATYGPFKTKQSAIDCSEAAARRFLKRFVVNDDPEHPYQPGRYGNNIYVVDGPKWRLMKLVKPNLKKSKRG